MARTRGARAATQARRKQPKATAARVHRFVRYDTPYVLPKVAIDQGNGLAFTLDAVVNSSEFTALFDEYRIVDVEVSLILTGVSTPGGTYPMVYLSNDLDDIAVPTVLTLLQTEGVRIVPFTATKPVVRHRLRPAYVATSGVSGARDVWCDVAYPANKWFGVKMWFANYNTSAYPGTYIQLSVKYTLEFRNVR